MIEFQESKTKENLARSFAAECQEGARYQFMSKLAQKEGYQYMSNLIRTLAHNEMSHATQFFNKINEYGKGEVANIDINAGYPFVAGELIDVIKKESENEKNSGESIYPVFAKIARDEEFNDVAELFEMVAKVELSHEQLLEQLHEKLTTKKLYKSVTPIAFKCDSCGYVISSKQAPKICPLCKMEQGYYRIDLDINNDENCDCISGSPCKC